MATLRYSIDQLLRLRTNQCPKSLATIIGKSQDFEFVRPRSSENIMPTKNIANQSKEPSKDSSSGTSEEVLYKGNASRVTTDGEATEWKYRGRSGSELTATEPISAPAGVGAQHNEGFQKFYRAVVSPNHVRVTAGGRIVPNTRGPPSPLMKHPRDRGSMNGPPLPFSPGGPMGAFCPYPMPQVMPPYFPGFAPAPSPMMPMAYGFPMPAVPVMHPSAISSPGLHSQASGTSTLRDTVNTRTGDARPEQAVPEAKNDRPNDPPANSSGQSKPFQANGQWAGPVPPNIHPHFGGPFLPLNMMASTNFPLSPMPGAMMPPMQAGIGPMVPQIGHPSMPGVSPLASPAFPLPGTFPGPLAPPVSSIKPSEITRNQLQQLRSSLKYSQDQLQFNRHQIDENFMEQKIKDLQEQTQRFESLLRVQLAHEEAYYPKGDGVEESQQAPKPVDNAAPAALGTEMSEGATESNNSPVPQQESKYAATSYKKELLHPRSDFGINAGTGKGGEVTFKYDPNGRSDFGDPIKKPGLSRAAALAPVFNPGSNSLSGCLFDGSQSHSASTSNSAAAARQAVDAWIGASASASVMQLAPSVTAGSSRGGSTEEEPETFGIPYLVGTLPAHLNAKAAVDTDYNYPRPLTEDELRARFLYWGKAPRSARRGLPKYDGKHFYPPSPMQRPVKAMVATLTETHTSSSSPALQVHGTDNATLHYPQPASSLSHPRSRSDEPDKTLASALVHDGPAVRRFRSFRSQVDSSSDAMPHAIEATSAFDDTPIKSTGTSETEISSEKRSDKYGSKLWHAMLKKIPSSIAISAATAQGSRSNITGHGGSSLSPVIANAVMSPPRSSSPTKLAEISGGGGALLTPIPETGDENRPPRGPGTLEEHFRALAVNSGKRRSELSPSWK